MKSNYKTIILVPRLDNPGGVANYYTSIKPYLGDSVVFLNRGNDKDKSKLIRLLSDYFCFIKKFYKQNEVETIVINHSLGPGSFYRDGIYSLLAPNRYKKIIFFHGWNPEFEKKIDKSLFLNKWMEKTFLKADRIIVLSSEFKAKLQEWGYKGPISLETTLVDERLVEDEAWGSVSENRSKLKNPNLLYLGNVSKAKGVWEIADTLKHLNGDEKYEDIQLKIAGAGMELEALQQYAKNKGLNIVFLGYVR